MADISTELAAILSAVYGEDVRGSIHDAIEKINDVSEVVFTTGTAITSATSSSTGFYEDSLYLNTNTYELWKCVGTNSWVSQGIIKGANGNGIASISKTGTSGLVDTYTITYDDGNTDTFTVTNGANGSDGSVWYKGTALTGTGTGITGFPGNQNDFYLNSSTGMVYNCTATGGASAPGAATWDYVMTMSGGGGSSVTVVDNLNSTSATDALSANQGHELNTKKIGDPTTKSNGDVLTYNGSAWVAQAPTTGSTSLAGLTTDVNIQNVSDNQFLRYDSVSSKWKNETVTIPNAANDGTLTIMQNSTVKGTFSADQVGNTSATIKTGYYHPYSAIWNSSTEIEFSGVDDSGNGIKGYDVYFDVTSNSTNLSPYAKLKSISGEGTNNATLTYETDADNGSTAKLWINQ